MPQRILLSLPFLLAGLSTHAQAPIERRPPPPPLSLWPSPSDIPSGTRLLIETFDHPNGPVCILRTIDTYSIVCAGPHDRPSAIYPREIIASIATVGRHYIPDHLPATVAWMGVGSVLLGGSCGADGGPACKTPAIIGLSLLATGGVLAIIQHHQRIRSPQMLYVAAYPPPTRP
jgi:hypothetical protein